MTTPELGTHGAWLHPRYDDEQRLAFAVEAERLGYGTVWLGIGSASVGDLSLVERILDATRNITVATAIVNMWNDPAETVAASYRRLARRHGDRLLLGLGLGHPESTREYRAPYTTMVGYLDRLDAAGVPRHARMLGALGPKALRLAADRTLGAHPYLVTPEHTRRARRILGAESMLVPEHKVVLEADPVAARAVGRPEVRSPYLGLRNYTQNLLRTGYTEDDIADGGSDRLIDDLVLHGDTAEVVRGLNRHLDAGADHVGVQVLVREGGSPMPAFRALASVLF